MRKMRAIDVKTRVDAKGLYYDVEYMDIKDIAKEKLEAFFKMYPKYDWNDKEKYWEEAIDKCPERIYEFFDNNKTKIISDVTDKTKTKLYKEVVDILCDCVEASK